MKHHKIKITDTLLCVLKSPDDRERVFKGFYRIPLKKSPSFLPKYLAFYQPSRFGKSGKKIEIYSSVKNWKIKRRKEILPEEKENPESSEFYILFSLNNPRFLLKPVKNTSGMRVSFKYTSLKKLLNSDTLKELFDIPPVEEMLSEILKNLEIPFKRQYVVKINKKKHFRLDFAIKHNNILLDIECDGFKWHSLKKQIKKDSERDALLQSRGWKVLRIQENLFLKNTDFFIKKIKDLISSEK